ncbi:hypothetical protein Z042_14715 [Chania multitudinisentens RB-25]|uniref:Uncharacterized protein n=1 Tax=Chania multitudinisentens RB-25 TaxID=1441930 RepID=W0LEL5_9GAMM|nr:hypothetical protein [Chania multitudinisentens]AHG20722.2 hypothetical protein Z042_14715 [Chania multitudinisentens RB-25]
MLNLIKPPVLDQEELIEQCFALSYSMQHVEQAPVKESLSFILLEKISALILLMTTETAE